jgi:hypothetical protein
MEVIPFQGTKKKRAEMRDGGGGRDVYPAVVAGNVVVKEWLALDGIGRAVLAERIVPPDGIAPPRTGKTEPARHLSLLIELTIEFVSFDFHFPSFVSFLFSKIYLIS